MLGSEGRLVAFKRRRLCQMLTTCGRYLSRTINLGAKRKFQHHRSKNATSEETHSSVEGDYVVRRIGGQMVMLARDHHGAIEPCCEWQWVTSPTIGALSMAHIAASTMPTSYTGAPLRI
jgi:hypothetical protein